jgi:hypothetical protein
MSQDDLQDDVYLAIWALDRLLNYQYECRLDKNGNLETLELGLGLELVHRNKQDDPELIEETLKSMLPQEDWEALLSLKEFRTPERLELVLDRLLLLDEASRGRQELKATDWPGILRFLHGEFKEPNPLSDKLIDFLVKAREGFSTTLESSIEGMLRPNVLSELITNRYIREVRNLLPRIVKRATLLRLLPARYEVPEDVDRYLKEASRCFIYGHFLASLFLCRSAIISATKDRLRANGFDRELDAICKDWLKSTLEMAHDKNLLDNLTWKQADDIRDLANDAIHGKRLPTEEECKAAFDKTRGILQFLYE